LLLFVCNKHFVHELQQAADQHDTKRFYDGL